MTLPPPMPQFMDASTGEPLMLTTDHYRILDREALAGKLAACAELEQDDDGHWVWLEEGSDGQLRARVSLTIDPPESEWIELFCRTRKLADQGRAWFEALAGDSVEHQRREISDPQEAMNAGEEDLPPDDFADDQPEIPPQEFTRLVEEAIKRTYADWADQQANCSDQPTQWSRPRRHHRCQIPNRSGC